MSLVFPVPLPNLVAPAQLVVLSPLRSARSPAGLCWAPLRANLVATSYDPQLHNSNQILLPPNALQSFSLTKKKKMSRSIGFFLATTLPIASSARALPRLHSFSTLGATLLKTLPPRPKPPPDSEIEESYLKGSGPGGQKIVRTDRQRSHIICPPMRMSRIGEETLTWEPSLLE